MAQIYTPIIRTRRAAAAHARFKGLHGSEASLPVGVVVFVAAKLAAKLAEFLALLPGAVVRVAA